MKRLRLLLATLLAIVGATNVSAQEVYAVYTSDNTTLTFYYDNQRSSRTGDTYDLNTSGTIPVWYSNGTCSSVTKVVFNSSFSSARPTTTFRWFCGMSNLTTISGLMLLNTTQVTDMQYMFKDCSSLTTLDLSSFNTDKVTNMYAMFNNCSSLTSLDLSSFNTKKVANMYAMFYNCRNLTSLDLSSFNTANVTDMGNMFGSCLSLTSLNLGSFNTNKVTNMHSMFLWCTSLNTVYVGSGWSTENVTESNSKRMFETCNALVGDKGTTFDANHIDKAYARIDGGNSSPGYFTDINTPKAYARLTDTKLTFYFGLNWSMRTGSLYYLNEGYNDPDWQSNNTPALITSVEFDRSFANVTPTSIYHWFKGMRHLTTITGLKNLNTSAITDMGSLFEGCTSLTSIDLSGFNTANVTNMYCMFKDCNALNTLDLISFNTEKVVNMSGMFQGCTALTTIYAGSGWSTTRATSNANMFYNCTSIRGGNNTTYDANHVDKTYARIDGGTSSPGYFTETSARQPYVIMSNDNTKLTFYCDNLQSLREGTLLELNTGGTDPAWVGFGNTLTTVEFDPSFVTARPTSTYRWFYNMAKVTSITSLEHLNTSQVTNMGSMFENCYLLESLDLNFFNTGKVTNMRNMFSGCRSLTSLNLGYYWVTDYVTDMFGMFANCSALGFFNVSNWYTDKVTTMQNMFSNCSALRGLDVSNWNISSVTTTLGMFENCSALRDLDVSNWNTGNVGFMYNMFKNCSNLTSLEVSNWDTSKVTNMGSLFYGCDKLTTLDLTGWNTALVNNMDGMFYNCSGLKTISVGSRWSTSAVTSPGNMFTNCTSLVGGAGTTYSSDHVEADYAHIDGGMSNPGYLSGLPYAVFNSNNQFLTFYNDGNQNSYGGASTVYNLNDADEPSWSEKKANVKYVNFDASFAYVRPTIITSWFDGMTNLEQIYNIENLNTSEVTAMNAMFFNCSKLRNLELSNFDTGNVTNMGGMFYGCSNLTNLDLTSFNTAKVETISTMFEGCSNLTTIYVGNEWNVEGAEYSERMFKDCTSLVGGAGTTFDADKTDKTYARLDGFNGKKGYLSAKPYVVLSSDNKTLTFYCDGQQNSSSGTVYNLNTGTNDPGWYDKRTSVTTVVFDASFAKARPTSTYNWFAGMTNLATITDIRYLNTSSVTNMKYMFSACNKLTSLDLSTFNTENVTDMYGMFYNCTRLTSLDVSSFNTANVTLMTNMFYYCTGLTTLDLSSFNTANVTSMYGMFNGCSSLETILASGYWKTEKVTSSTDMFKNCTSLEGGAGTRFDSSNPTDKTYAHIDGGTSNPGYFTATPYVVVSDGTLTFYCDGMPEGTYDGQYAKLNKNGDLPNWLITTGITTVVFDPSFASARPTTTNHWFYNMQNLETITGLEYLNTSKVTNMSSMFQGCQKLISLNLGKWNTANVTDMVGMFFGCSALTSIMVNDGWNTDHVSSSADMFKGCESLLGGAGTTYDANHTDKTYAIIDGGEDNPGYLSGEPYARYGIYSHELRFSCDGRRSYYENNTGYNVYDLNTGSTEPGWYDRHAEITHVSFERSFAAARPISTFHWFKNMTNIVGINGLENLNTSEVTNMEGMFSGCSSLTTLDLSGFNTAKVTSMTTMFFNCSALTSVDLSGFDTGNTIDMGNMFQNCTSLANLDLSTFNTSNVTNMSSMFFSCLSLNIIYVGNSWNTNKVNKSTYMFYFNYDLVGGAGTAYNDSYQNDKTYAHVDGGTSNSGYLTDIASREGYALYTSGNTTLTFYYDGLKTVRGGYALNTGNSEPAWYTDEIYGDVTTVVFDPSFADARPTSTSNWFNEMENLTTITGIEYLNTSEVTSMAGMFNTCSTLTSIDLSHFDTSNVTDMSSMFFYCSNLASLDLSHFDTSKVKYMSSMFGNCSNLTSLDLQSFNTANVKNMVGMFAYCDNLTTILVGEGWNTENVTTSNEMFIYCTNLKGGAGTAYTDENPIDKTYAHIDCGAVSPGYLSALPYVVLDTETQTITYYSDGKKGTHTAATEVTCDLNGENFLMDWMSFRQMNSNNVKYAVIDPSFASARLTSMHSWFEGFYNLESITGLEYFNTSAVTDMGAMFYGCNKLTSLDLSHFDTSNVTDMSNMFNSCSALTDLDVSGFNTENVTDMNSMFSSCTGLTGLYLGSFNTAHVTNMRSMFSGCSALATIYVDENKWSTSSVPFLSNGQSMFTGCIKLEGGNGTSFSTDHVDYDYAHVDGGMSNPGYFTEISELLKEPYAEYSEENNTLTFYYDKLRSTRTNRTFNLNTGSSEPDWESESSSVTNVVFDPSFAAARPTTTYGWFYNMENLTSITGIEYLNTSEVTNMYAMFMKCRKLRSLDLSSFNTAKVTNMYAMFAKCSNLKSLDLSSFNTENVTDMYAMFYECSSLTSINLSSFNTANVTNMSAMFYECSRLNSINLSSFNTANVTNMSAMFYDCSFLTSLDLSSFNTQNVTNMYAMFNECRELTSLDLSSFNTANVTNMSVMFNECNYLTSLDLSSFNTQNVTNMYGMFWACLRLTTIYAGVGWTTNNVTPGYDVMFGCCFALEGGNGTSYNSNNVGADYAHIDVLGDPGYFTAIPYVVLSTDRTTITFYHDGYYNKEGTIYYLRDWIKSAIANYMCTDVTTAVFDPSFADARPTTTSYWFYGMENLTTITGMEYLNTSEVTDMNRMFAGCSSLTILDLSSFNTANVKEMIGVFNDCTSLTTIFAGDGWTTDNLKLTGVIFHNCIVLEGGKGTKYDEDHLLWHYARIDDPDNGKPGYFTDKADFIPGDANGDRAISIADVTAVVSYILSNGHPTGTFNVDAANADGVEGITIQDATAIVNMILNK